jgi:CheY-like chemotaxis protein
MNDPPPPYRILLVDDEPDITYVVGTFLEKHGYKVDTFTSSREALSAFKPHLYHLAIIDIKMPEIDGFQLYERLAAIDPNIKVCFITAYDLANALPFRQQHKERIPADCYVTKPIYLPRLLEIIQRQLGNLAVTEN